MSGSDGWADAYTPRYAAMPPMRFVPASAPAAAIPATSVATSGEEVKAFYQQVTGTLDAPPEDDELSYCSLCEVKLRDQDLHSKSIGHMLARDRTPAVIPTYYKLRADSKGWGCPWQLLEMSDHLGRYRMLTAAGWVDPEKGLGKDGQGRLVPLQDSKKHDMLGLGLQKVPGAPVPPKRAPSHGEIVAKTQRDSQERQAMLRYLND
jgi:hypothetical protein